MAAQTRYTFPPVGRCIYCGSTTRLSEEHIIPYSLNGHLVLPKASCAKCAETINRFEQFCTRTTYFPLRQEFKLKSRRKKKNRPNCIRMKIVRDGQIETVDVLDSEYPKSHFRFYVPPPGILRGVTPAKDIDFDLRIRWKASEAVRLTKQLNLDKKTLALNMANRIDPDAFFLLLAKIAHGYAVARFGIDSFKHRLPALILNKQTSDTLPYLIGCDPKPAEPNNYLHVLEFGWISLHDVIYCRVAIQLFAMLGSPRYLVIVGEDFTNEVRFT
jgi:HNH endonuclease